MNKQDAVSHWKTRALKELKAAQTLFDQSDENLSGQVLFHCHLAIELAMKAKYIEENNDKAPFTHDINELAVLLYDSWSEEKQDAFEELSTFAILARYGDEEWFEEHATTENAKKWLRKTEEFLSTLQQ